MTATTTATRTGAARSGSVLSEQLAGTGPLVRLALRRDRWLLPIWVLLFAFISQISVTATRDLYPNQESMVSASETINATAALVALYGRIYDTSSLGAVSLIKMTAFGAALVAVVMVFFVVRHTRSEEESGRLELVGGGVVGMYAPLAAGLIVGFGTSMAIGAVTCLGLITTGLPLAGCLAFGLGWALTGIVFSAAAAVAAQLTTGGRAAIGLGMIAIGVAYTLRAVGDLTGQGPGWASWLSPIGWSQQIRPFAGDRWWVVAIPVLATAVMVPVAFVLRGSRDLGSGYVPDRPGPADGRLAQVGGLAWRLQRGILLAWVAGAVLLGAVLGSVAHNITGLLDSPEMKSFFVMLGGEKAIVDAFIAAEVAIMGSLMAAYAIAATSRLRAEEVPGHAEMLLATPTTRTRWALSHYVLALGGVTVLLAATGAAVGLGHGLSVGDAGQVWAVIGAALAQVPAAWVLAGITIALFGWLPRAVAAAWAFLVAFILLGEFGALWHLPQWVLDLSPYAHVPRLPGATVDWPQLAGLLIVALVLSVIGFAGWRRRDLSG